jgi:tetratricopeptide (TPR) repeat protein
MRVARHVISLVAVLVIGGCAAPHRAAPTSSTAAAPTTRALTVAPATRPQLDPKAYLALDEIEPRPVLAPMATPTTSTYTKPPLEALELYARARDALAANQRFTAVNLLEKAVRIDPYSAEPLRLLSRAYSLSGASQAKAIEVLKRAAELEPNDLRTQVSLARLYLMRNDAASATTHLRLALQTRDYQTDDAGAATADYFLARAVQQQGYDRAAIDRYESLLRRLKRPTLSVRGDPEANDWASRPEAIYADLARLYEKRGDWERALANWRAVEEQDSDDFDARVHEVNMLVNLGRRDDALRSASDTVRRAGATPRALELLRDVCRRLGDEEAAFQELRQLQREKPNDRSVLFALSDLLAVSNRESEAEQLLSRAARQSFDSETVRKLYRFYADRHRSTAAMTLLIEAAAAKPDQTSELLNLASDLTQPTRSDQLRAGEIERLHVPKTCEAAKQFFTAAVAFSLISQREGLGRDALERSMKPDPPFAPAFRLAMVRILARPEIDVDQRIRQADALVDSVRARGDTGLADELAGMSLARQNNREGDASAAFERAIKAYRNGPPPPDLLMTYADFLQLSGNTNRMEQTLWRVISDYPTFADTYDRLMRFHAQRNAPAAAINVLQRWLAADPTNVEARLAEAEFLITSGQVNEGLRGLAELVRQNPEGRLALVRAGRMYQQVGRAPQFVQLLEEIRSRQPKNIAVAEQLVEIYATQQRLPEATRIADATKAACAGEPRSLYYVAQLYNRVRQKEQSQGTLEEVLRLAPDDPGANNDLGYTWADDGKNLERAERMIRHAVEAEPDNPSFLDSLGWVLYKRGSFEEARHYLQQSAAGSDGPADPVVLDHLGDTLYRLHDLSGAVSHWKRSLEQLSGGIDRDDLAALRPSLQDKLRQADQGQPVKVAPSLGGSTTDPVGAPDRPARAER